MATFEQVTKVLTFLAATYPNFKMAKETPRAYHVVLKDIEPKLLQTAAIQLASTSKWFPAASELRLTALELTNRAKGLPCAAEAWGEVMRQVSVVGYYGKPEFSTDIVYRAVDALGGWRAICTSETIMADRAHFLKIYESLLDRKTQDAAMLPEVREMVQTLAAAFKIPQLEEGDR